MKYHFGFMIVAAMFATGGCAVHNAAYKARASGAKQARVDIESGKLVLQTYGLVDPHDDAFERLLSEKLGVKRINAGACVMPEVLRIEAYNRVMEAEIERRFGPGSLERLREEAATTAATQPADVAPAS